MGRPASRMGNRNQHATVEAASAAARPPSSLWTGVKTFLGQWGLIIVLLVMPVVYGIQDLSNDGNLTRLGNNLVAGLSNGSIWALVALGYTLVYGIIELITFAHGDLFMIGSVASYGLFGTLGITLATGTLGVVGGLFVTLIVAMLLCASLNVMIERVGYRPLRSAPKLAPLITAVGFSFILQDVGQLWIGGSQQGVPDLIRGQMEVFSIAGISVAREDVLAIGVTIPLYLLLTWFVNTTRSGKAMRATAQDPEAARLMGINVDSTISLTFMLGGLLAGAGGLVYALYPANVWFFQGVRAGPLAFTAAVVGGVGNPRGAGLGGFPVGVIPPLSHHRIRGGGAAG